MEPEATPRPKAASLWRAVDRLSSLATLTAFCAFVVGAAFVIRDGGGATSASQVTAAGTAVDQESIAGDVTMPLGRIVKGHESARLAVVEFSDFECPYCARYATGTHARLEREYVDTGKVRYAFRHLPLTQIHPNAVKAAEAAECAGRQGRFWDMYDQLFANRTSLGPENLAQHAAAIGLDRRGFAACLDGAVAAEVAADRDEAVRLAVTSTPTFLIGEITGPNEMRIVRRVKGAYPPDVFIAVLDELQEQLRR